MITDLLIFFGLVAVAIALLVGNRRREQKRLRMRTREALSPALKQEIESERAEALEKKKKFDEAMWKASGGRSPSGGSGSGDEP